MKITAFAARALAGLLVASIAVTATAAPRQAPSKDLVGDPSGGPSTTAFFFGSGFEAGEGFAVGPIEPQNGWTATGVNLPWASIATPNPFTGSQHLRVIKNPAAGAGAGHVLLSPNNPTPANTPSTVYVKLNLSNDGGADYEVIGQAPSQGFLSWRVVFSFAGATVADPGTIFILDNLGMGLVFVNTGVVWTEGAYEELRVDFNPGINTIDYYYSGSLIHSGVLPAGTAVEQMVFLHDNFQLAGETGDYDALSVQTVGEPPVGVEATTWSNVKAMMR